jgi:hypothetical protein
MMQAIVVRMDERQHRLFATLAVLFLVNAYAIAQLVLGM